MKKIPIALILALSDSIHLLTGYFNAKLKPENENLNEEVIISNVFEKYIVPSFITSLTTSVAFSSFLFSDVVNIRSFGLVSSCIALSSFFCKCA